MIEHRDWFSSPLASCTRSPQFKPSLGLRIFIFFSLSRHAAVVHPTSNYSSNVTSSFFSVIIELQAATTAEESFREAQLREKFIEHGTQQHQLLQTKRMSDDIRTGVMALHFAPFCFWCLVWTAQMSHGPYCCIA
jgi:hypothetical protein